jgi:oxygen-independent coproporphyrinogen III oxidase
MQISGSSVYLHVPFCKKKCPYCHFYSIFSTPELINLFVDALICEIKNSSIENKNITSVYFGGGTPSLIGPDNLFKILQTINITDKCEVTLETNPEQVEFQEIKNFKKAGVTRISLGVQSLNDEELQTLQRGHSSKKALVAIDQIFEAGVTNISIDLMYDLPGQKIESFEKTLKKTQGCPIKHISLYNLTFEVKTPFHKNFAQYVPFLPSSEESLQMLQLALSFLEEQGYKRYEISAFAKEKYHSQHNVGYWTGREFFGFGPSAFSYVQKRRYQNIPNLKKYFSLINNQKSTVWFEEKLSNEASLRELLAINLRLIEGVNLSLFQKKLGRLPKKLEIILKSLIAEGLLEEEEKQLRLTEKGLLFYDLVAEKII